MVGAESVRAQPARPDDTIAALAARLATSQGESILLVAPETQRTLDYAGLGAFARRLDAWFDSLGVGRGAVVAQYLPNGLAAAAIFLATMASGRVIAPLNLLAQRSQLQYVLGHCDARLLLCSPELAGAARAALPSQRGPALLEIDPDCIDDGPWRDAVPSAALAAVARDAPALLMYTSGTTGTPKGVPLTHANLLHAARAVAGWHGLTHADRVLSALPLYHINGQVIATVTPFASGGSIVAPRRFSVSTWWDSAVQHRCTWLNMVPTIIAYLLNEEASAPQRLSDVRFARSASAPLPPEHQRAFEARFGVPVIEAMGMTESSSIVFCNPMPPAARRIGSPGVPIGVEARIVDVDGAPLANGVRGEIWLRGASVMRGYYKSAEQTAAALTDDGWLRSGDLGYRDDDGFYFITGRLKELIIKGGENIAPREIDEALLRHPAVLEAAAVGVPDPSYGQEILAAVVLKPGMQLTEDELRAFCVDELGRYKTPRHFRFLAELPKGPSGKIQRLKLLDD